MSSVQANAPVVPGPPKIARTDGRETTFKEFHRRKFTMKIDSVYFNRSPGPDTRVRCAVLISYSFILSDDDKLTSADVPLLADMNRSNTEGVAFPDIAENYPDKQEFVKVGHVDGVKLTRLAPEVMLEVLGVGAGVGGMGVEYAHSDVKDYLISLQPVRLEIDGKATQLMWRCRDDRGVFYPGTVQTLIVVEKDTGNHDGWFPFRLHLSSDLRVKVKNSWQILSLVHSLSNREGWHFNIRGNYNKEAAAQALSQACGDEEGTSHLVGLKVAAIDWLRVCKQGS
ncbi:hypothetical protein FA15DRAFT_758850 [Coprinopsis marcescibilis]|uniref:Uncharacterized protein n=1 Tax=Coprinopsis marcescibilis TaxID=230819 RepID=A0A5C3KMZ2_COPMA|nr:hypothetical protein FA15DRAFT_758850 [Coprinopsis marcescibilis]